VPAESSLRLFRRRNSRRAGAAGACAPPGCAAGGTANTSGSNLTDQNIKICAAMARFWRAAQVSLRALRGDVHDATDHISPPINRGFEGCWSTLRAHDWCIQS
jgi:hypothetical protein